MLLHQSRTACFRRGRLGKESLNEMVNKTHYFSSGPSCEEEGVVLNVGHLHFYWFGGDVRLFVHSYTHI